MTTMDYAPSPALAPVARTRAGWLATLRVDDTDIATHRPRWAKYSLWGLLAVTAVLYLWNLSASGWANSFYSAAAQAGADNWTAFLFGSSDIGNSITVDKPPAAIWVMALSVKLFGLNSWAMLAPQALMGVAAVFLLNATVRRWYGEAAGLIAAAVLAFTPVAVLMFRFNNPDALLVLLLIAAAYALTRALEHASLRWIALAGVIMGFAFLTKSLQALLVLPGFALAYAVAAPTTPARRIRDLAVAFAAMVVAGGWWVLLVELWPADSRPFIGGSQTNSAWELIMGYNGLGRITGDETGSVVPGGGTGQGGMWGETGWQRLFSSSWAGGIAWLLPAAFVLAAVAFVLTRSQARTGRLRAGLIIWTGWLLVTWFTFSFASGIIHEYYAVALAPGIAAVVAIGVTLLWRLRDQLAARITLTVVWLGSAFYGAWLLTRAGGVYLNLGVLVATAAVLIATGWWLLPAAHWQRITAIAALVALLAGPLAFSVQTAASAHTGSLPTAGPTLSGGTGRGGPGGGFGGRGPGGGTPPQAPGGTTGAAPQAPGGTAPQGGPGGGGGMGGLLDASAPSEALVQTLSANADQFTWVAAAIGSQTAAGYQLGTGYSVMPIGGFNGSDPSPTLAQFQQWVASGEIHYFIAGGSGGGMGGSGTASEISQWVSENFTSSEVDGVTLYDLTQPA